MTEVEGQPVEKSTRRAPFLSADAIIDAAFAVADRDGYEKLSIRRVAAEADASPMSLYRHFRNRRHIEVAMVVRLIGDLLDAPSGIALDATDRAVLAIAVCERLRMHGWLAAMLTTETQDRDAAGAVQGLADRVRHALGAPMWWLILGRVTADPDGTRADEEFRAAVAVLARMRADENGSE